MGQYGFQTDVALRTSRKLGCPNEDPTEEILTTPRTSHKQGCPNDSANSANLKEYRLDGIVN